MDALTFELGPYLLSVYLALGGSPAEQTSRTMAG